MTEKTREYKRAYECDIRRIFVSNHRSEQSRNDIKRFYTMKWQEMEQDSSTATQKNLCYKMLQLIEKA